VELAPSIIEILRDTTDDIQDRWIRITIDDAPVEILKYGETLRRQVPPGRHRLNAHNTLSSDRLEIETAPGQTVRIRCSNRFSRTGPLMLLTMGVAFIKVKLELVDS
jgi:hypothetical protein